MSNVIDLSAATPGSRAVIEEKRHNETVTTTALQQLLAILGQGLSTEAPAEQRAAVELIQMEGMAIAVEYLAQQCGIGEHDAVKALRGQIIEENASRVRAYNAANGL